MPLANTLILSASDRSPIDNIHHCKVMSLPLTIEQVLEGVSKSFFGNAPTVHEWSDLKALSINEGLKQKTAYKLTTPTCKEGISFIRLNDVSIFFEASWNRKQQTY
jgi:hypothetical protein